MTSPREQQPLCTDDLGESVYLDFYTKQLLWASKARWVGSILPQCSFRNVTGGEGWEEKYKESVKAFNDMDMNCNTCSHLQRIKHPKSRLGYLEGVCTKKDNTPLKFHPHNCMYPENNDCYSQRQ